MGARSAEAAREAVEARLESALHQHRDERASRHGRTFRRPLLPRGRCTVRVPWLQAPSRARSVRSDPHGRPAPGVGGSLRSTGEPDLHDQFRIRVPPLRDEGRGEGAHESRPAPGHRVGDRLRRGGPERSSGAPHSRTFSPRRSSTRVPRRSPARSAGCALRRSTIR